MGDIKNINYIVNAYGDMLFRVAYQYTRNRSEAEDVTQDVFVAMLKKMPFKSEEHLKAWLIRVAINKSINYLKSSRKKVLSLDENIDVEAKHSETDEIEELQPKVDALDAEVAEANSRIIAAENEIAQKEQDMADREDGLNERLRVMYKNGSVGFIDVLLGSSSISEFVSNLDLIQRIYQNRN